MRDRHRQLTDFYKKHIPFSLTGAQKKVIKECYGDMSTGTVGAVKPSLSVAGTDGASKAIVGVDVGEDVLDADEDDGDDSGDGFPLERDVGDEKLLCEVDVVSSLVLRAAILCRSCAFSISND